MMGLLREIVNARKWYCIIETLHISVKSALGFSDQSTNRVPKRRARVEMDRRNDTWSWADAFNSHLQYFVLLHFCHNEADQSFNRLVDVGGIEGIGCPGPNQLSIWRTVDIVEIGFDAHLFFFLQVPWR